MYTSLCDLWRTKEENEICGWIFWENHIVRMKSIKISIHIASLVLRGKNVSN